MSGFSRRVFLKNSVAAGIGAAVTPACVENQPLATERPIRSQEAKVISTWNHGLPANEEAWSVLENGGSALDAAEAGVKVVEADPKYTSVGYGGLPDRDGKVTLDACIMDHDGNAGSVSFLQDIVHPISVARRVMEETPHVMLVGEGAKKFAIEQGFELQNLLTEESRRAWIAWLKTSEYNPEVNVENHDTIGMICQDSTGNLSASCTTSGMAYKMHGRVGDSPIIGAGLYVDNDSGACVATGMGELMLKTLGSFLVVEFMRQGKTAQEACEAAIGRIVEKLDYKEFQVAYLAMDISGATGAYCIQPGFNYAEMYRGENNLIDARSFIV
ncbi:MAG: N(4)-(beta-N-acetylglucosaminyl)-L-asparaginase [Cyclobacteriaceae bacterium]